MFSSAPPLKSFLMFDGIEPFSLPDADGDADVPEETVHQQQNEIDDAPFERDQLEGGGDNVRRRQPEDEAEDPADNDL